MKNFNIVKRIKETSRLNPNILNKRYNESNIYKQQKQENKNKISEDNISTKMNLIKTKYELKKNQNDEFVLSKIQTLKDKYLNNNSKSKNFRISSTNAIILNKKNPFSIQQNYKNKRKINLYRTSSLKLVKESSINFRSKNKNNSGNECYFNNSLNNQIINKDNLYQKFKYLNNSREQYVSIQNKIKEISIFEKLNKNPKYTLKCVFPLAKKIKSLSEVKKDIKFLNKGKKDIPIEYKTMNKDDKKNKKNLFNELFVEEDNILFNKNENNIMKPVLIRSLSRPKLDVPHYKYLYKF